ncbi:hypothetical protein BHE74_00059878 [Ensete ventricosum]|nr:hypothetical protein BHE74_00059878 [Ensete ventricosum]
MFSSEELMDQAAMSMVWVELGTSEQHRRDLELVADTARIKLSEFRESHRRLEDEFLLLMKGAKLLQSELKAKGNKAMVEYKASQGFQSRLEKMG